MNQYNQQKREIYIKKLVSNSKAIITNQVAIPLGCRKMAKILNWINNIEPLNEINLSFFLDYDSEIGSLPVGTERLLYNKDFLLSEDVKLDRITAKYKKQIIEKCFEIVSLF